MSQARRERVLLAEDDADIRDIVRATLERGGIAVVAVADGLAALAQATADPPDLFIFDVRMPGISGLELCELLRRRPATAAVPIILLTARAQDADVSNGLAAGADEYITKPFSPQHLIARVRALLG
jgi:DNA-binding response OmpR family regulator